MKRKCKLLKKGQHTNSRQVGAVTMSKQQLIKTNWNLALVHSLEAATLSFHVSPHILASHRFHMEAQIGTSGWLNCWPRWWSSGRGRTTPCRGSGALATAPLIQLWWGWCWCWCCCWWWWCRQCQSWCWWWWWSWLWASYQDLSQISWWRRGPEAWWWGCRWWWWECGGSWSWWWCWSQWSWCSWPCWCTSHWLASCWCLSWSWRWWCRWRCSSWWPSSSWSSPSSLPRQGLSPPPSWPSPPSGSSHWWWTPSHNSHRDLDDFGKLHSCTFARPASPSAEREELLEDCLTSSRFFTQPFWKSFPRSSDGQILRRFWKLVMASARVHFARIFWAQRGEPTSQNLPSSWCFSLKSDVDQIPENLVLFSSRRRCLLGRAWNHLFLVREQKKEWPQKILADKISWPMWKMVSRQQQPQRQICWREYGLLGDNTHQSTARRKKKVVIDRLAYCSAISGCWVDHHKNPRCI